MTQFSCSSIRDMVYGVNQCLGAYTNLEFALNPIALWHDGRHANTADSRIHRVFLINNKCILEWI